MNEKAVATTHWVYTAAGVERSKNENGETNRYEGMPIERADTTTCSQLWVDRGWVREA